MLRTRWFLLLACLSCAGCTGGSKLPAPTTTEKPKSESDLAFATISKKAVQSLGIKTQPAEVTEIEEQLTLTGWVMAKPGNEVTLTAPAAGYVEFPRDKPVPFAGNAVKEGDELLQLKPEFSPLEKIQVDSLKRSIESDLAKAEKTQKLTDIEYKRTQSLVKTKVRTEQDLQQAQNALDNANIELAAARDKLGLFEKRNKSLTAPLSGTILQVYVGKGQYVPVSAPLVTIINLQPTWVRVPVPEYDLQRVDLKASIQVHVKDALNGRHDRTTPSAGVAVKDNAAAPFLEAMPMGRVSQVDPIKHTAELWYELVPEKNDKKSAPRIVPVKDEMVTVYLPVKATQVNGEKEKAALVPYSAIVYDTHGQSWIYVDRSDDKSPKQKYERRHVEVLTAVGERLAIRPAANGERIVTSGAAALYSREFHKTPVSFPGEDD